MSETETGQSALRNTANLQALRERTIEGVAQLHILAKTRGIDVTGISYDIASIGESSAWARSVGKEGDMDLFATLGPLQADVTL